MNNQRTIKRVSSFILILALIFSIAPVGDIAYGQEPVKTIESVKTEASLNVVGYEDKDILSLKKTEFKKDDSVLDFILRNLDENKVKYIADKGYISEVDGLAAFDKGQYSGWMTRVNGQYPNVGIADVKLKSGDLVELVYIQNYNSIFNAGKGQIIVKGYKDEEIVKTDFLDYKKDENTLDFIKRVLDNEKVEYKADQGYFEMVDGLANLDKGENSGWMVKVNDLMPEVGLLDIVVSDGIVIELFYVEDYNTLFPPTEGGDVDELFVDMDKHEWAKEAVDSLAIDGVIEGTGNNKFSPANEVTRAEFATMVSRLLKLEEVGENKFKDLKESNWYYKDVLRLANKGLINGRENGSFDPNAKITRQEISTILGNILVDNKISLKNKDALKIFADYKDIAKWAVDGSGLVVQEEIVNGIDGKFMPKKNATRAESATMLFRLNEKIK